MDQLERVITNLVIANRILANEGVVDAYGHVSVRHPQHSDRYLLSRSRSPQLVDAGDIMEFTLEGQALCDDRRQPYLERFIHGAIYRTRADVHAVVHSHADEVLPFAISSGRLRPVVHTAGCLGKHIPLWDIRDKFGDTNLLVTNLDQGHDLAAALGENRVVLMRGHGFAAAASSLTEVTRMAVYMPRNAKVLLEASRFGEVKALSAGEIEIRTQVKPDSAETWRAWEYWATRAGCAHLLEQPLVRS
jgi:ribulose-5-phosphate 4-epimerase/fuculose-1-phosphate aldolase